MPKQFRLSTVFVFVAIVAMACAGITSSNEVVRLATVAILAANALGWVVGMFLTHTMKFPRDGSYRYEAFEQEDDDVRIQKL